jgi:hypothetical protein
MIAFHDEPCVSVGEPNDSTGSVGLNPAEAPKSDRLDALDTPDGQDCLDPLTTADGDFLEGLNLPKTEVWQSSTELKATLTPGIRELCTFADGG